MCGILGITGKDIENEKPQDLISLISHRGPDVSGIWQSRDKSVWLGHTRLSIIELSNLGNQPMKSVCENFILIYNGEIYNHLEIRRNLIKLGYKFRGESDTEVVLNACIEWGVEMASKLFIGMFAFAFFNNKENSLWLSRDKLGIKPLYFIYENNNFAFSSEIRPILNLSWVKKTINKCSLINYFRYGYSSAPNTIINNINQLEAGTILLRKNSNIKFFKYWDHRKIAYEGIKIRNNSISFREYSELLEAELKKSIKNHLQSDVNYGAFISGGIDSSIVCSLMQSVSSKSIKTFSLGFSEKSHDESKYAADIANYLGTDHNEIILNPKELISSIPSQNRKLITTHESLGYLEAKFGLEVLSTIIPDLDSSNEISPSQLVGVIDVIEDNNVKVIFIEAEAPSVYAETIVAETGIKAVEGLWVETLRPGQTYPEFLITAVELIVENLSNTD